MTKIFAAPFEKPVCSFRDMKKSREIEKEFIEKVQEFSKIGSKTPNDKYVGKTIKFPHADGYAVYVVLSTKPLELIHLPIGDSWDSPYADLLTRKRMMEMVDSDEKMNELFPSRF